VAIKSINHYYCQATYTYNPDTSELKGVHKKIWRQRQQLTIKTTKPTI